MQEAGLPEDMKKHREIYTVDGLLKNMESHFNFIESGSGRDKRETDDLTYRYGVAPGHDKTNLALYYVWTYLVKALTKL